MRIHQEAIANISHRLEQLAHEIDTDADLETIVITVVIERRNRRIKGTSVALSRRFEPAAQGVILRAGLTGQKPTP